MTRVKRLDIDTPWKDILDTYFQPFVEYCWPIAAAEIDWSKGYETLDKELHAITKDALTTNRLVDKLIKVWRKGGEETWVLVHLEVQGQPDSDFAERMFVYRYRLYDRYRKPVASLAILADDNPSWRPTNFRQDLWGCHTEMQFVSVKLMDYKDRKPELETTHNPFGTVILAQLTALETRNNPQARLSSKIALTRLLYERGWGKADVLNLYRFIDWLITLPDSFELQYHQEIERIEEEKNVTYITTAERIGHQRGVVQGESTLLVRLLQHKFKVLPSNYLERIEQADADKLLLWGEKLMDASSLDDVFKEI